MKMNILDSLVSFFSPEAGLRRAKARLLTERVRGYDAAKQSRLKNGWYSPSTGANAEVETSLIALRDVSRELARNNLYMKRAIRVLSGLIVGDGITGWANDKRVQKAWRRWSESTECDARGQLNFSGLQRLICDTVIQSGECIVRFRPRRPSDGLTVPLQIEVNEPDHLDHTKTGQNGGNEIIQGVEIDPIGRVAAYWMHRRHPGEANGSLEPSVRVPAEEILHIYHIDRPGQRRGVPWGHAVVKALQNVGYTEEAIVTRLEMEASIGLVITSPDDSDSSPITAATTTDADGREIGVFEPGMLLQLPNGKQVSSIDPKTSTGQMEFIKHLIRGIGAGLCVTYAQIANDGSSENYTSMRAVGIVQNRMISQSQWQMMIPMLCEPVARRFVLAGFLAGLWKKTDAEFQWMPPKADLIDPEKDAKAALMMVRSGQMTIPQAIAAMGYDPITQVEEIAAFNGVLDALGVVLDSDPRRMSGAGNPAPQQQTETKAAA